MNYRLLTEESVDELHGLVSVYEHIRSGARVMCVKNQDKNKVFMISFRTTPEDSTGVAHIMEHSVLCGSRKYPIRDPFVELAKGSLNTFLNAMTYPDKTVYPIASTNDKDFKNLMDVYLDSVFYPNVLREEKIFCQEGWHYEVEGFETEDEKLLINGVVYNEMKGAFSSPDSVLERLTLSSLFPDTTYAFESGGAPKDIPNLSFDDLLAFHDRFYHPSNSYIYLYGDLDMDERLEYLDKEYLSHFEKIIAKSRVLTQALPAAPTERTGYYAVSDSENTKNKAFLSENFCIPAEASRLSLISFNILEYVLLLAPGAVLREALIKEGIGEEICGGYTGEIKQPYFSIIARNADPGRINDFKKIINDTLSRLCDEGINKKSLLASLNLLEFKCREEDFGSLPMGLATGLSALSSWIYDGDPFEFLYYLDTFKKLRKLIETDYFENLIKETFLENNFYSTVCVIPKKGLTRKGEEELSNRLKIYHDSLRRDEIKGLFKKEKELRAYQNGEESPEALKCLPVLSINDIEKKAEAVNVMRSRDIIFSEADAGKIAYIRVLFDTSDLSEEELSMAALVGLMLGELDTREHSCRDLFDEIALFTGGIHFSVDPFSVNEGDLKGYFSVSLRVFDERISEGIALIKEIINDSLFDDYERIFSLIKKARSMQQSNIEDAMHRVAAMRAGAYISKFSRYQDLTEGIGFYDFLCAAASLSEDKVHIKRFVRGLKAVMAKLFCEERVSFYLYGSKAAKESLKNEIKEFKKSLKKEIPPAAPLSKARLMNLSCLNEGLKTGSQVNFDAVAGDYRRVGLKYHGGLKVLLVMLNYEYLWMRLRVIGGAYGCMASFLMRGSMYMCSYRDPKVRETYQIFEELPDYLRAWDADEDTLRKYIIGAISLLDRPRTHSMKAMEELSFFIFGTSDEMRQRERDEILSCSVSDIRSFSEYIDALLRSGARCTIGNAGCIEECSDLFSSVRTLF